MITISTSTAPKLLHQNLVNKKIRALLNSIHPELHTTKPILSGSYLIKLVVAPDANYNDYDFYFTTEENYKNAFNILNATYSSPKQTKNSISYTLDSMSTQVQLIFRKFDDPKNIILDHDFKNCQVAWFKDDLYFSNGFKQAWKTKQLDLFLNQLPDFKNHNKWLAKLTVLTQRVKKYTLRYDLTLSSELTSLLSESHKLLTDKKHLFSTFEFSLLNQKDRDYFTTQEEEDKIFSLQSLQENIEDLIGG